MAGREPAHRALDRREVEIPVEGEARYLVLAHFCDWYEKEFFTAGEEAIDQVGELLATATIVYDNSTRHAAPIRRRFETNAPTAASANLPMPRARIARTRPAI